MVTMTFMSVFMFTAAITFTCMHAQPSQANQSVVARRAEAGERVRRFTHLLVLRRGVAHGGWKRGQSGQLWHAGAAQHVARDQVDARTAVGLIQLLRR